MEDPAALAAVLLLPVLLGFVLRRTGPVLAALGLAVYAVVGLTDTSSEQLVGAAALGSGGGFALGLAGALMRRGLRRRRRRR